MIGISSANTARTDRRRGVAVILVFLILALTMGLSYAAIRAQSGAAGIARNANRNLDARQAALTGAAMALRKMHTNAWGGVDTSIAGSLGDGLSFQADYAAGDPRLNSTHPEYGDLPFRVTISVVGRAVDPDNPQCVAEHHLRVITRLVPRALGVVPWQWNELTSATVYQNWPGGFTIYPGSRIEGPVRTQATVRIRDGIQWTPTHYNGYFLGLNQRRQAGMGDQRPFTGPIRIINSWQDWDTLGLLNTQMGVSTVSAIWQVIVYWTIPASTLSYRLYPGGPVYSAVIVGDRLKTTTLAADPATNPLGLFYRAGQIELRDDVTVHGTLMADRVGGANVLLQGKRIQLQPVDFPAIVGDSRPVQLPVVMAGDKLLVREDAQAELKGLVACFDTFDVTEDKQGDIEFLLEGKLIAGNVRIKHRSEWINPSRDSDWWENRWVEYQAQKDLPGGSKYFSDFLSRFYSLSSEPKIVIKPAPNNIRYHWLTLSQPIYVPASGDPGLRWQVLDWSER